MKTGIEKIIKEHQRQRDVKGCTPIVDLNIVNIGDERTLLGVPLPYSGISVEEYIEAGWIKLLEG